MSAGMMAFLAGLMILTRGIWAEEMPNSGVKKSPTDEELVAARSNVFGLEMYGRLAGKENGNLFFSPGSIDTALAMTYAGAGGETAKQMGKVLYFDVPPERLHPAFAMLLNTLNHPAQVDEYRPDASGQLKAEKVPAYALVVANALWGQKGYGFKPEFTRVVAKSYGGGMNEVDFAHPEEARGVINKWVEDQTHDKIKDLIGHGVLTPLTRLVLTNAVYFKSNWAEQFQKAATQDEAFHVSAEKSVDVAMMHQRNHFGYMETEALQLVELPYKGNELSMVILLPKQMDGLGAVEKSLTAQNISKWLESGQGAMVDLTLPKWKFSSEFGLGKVLQSMGMTDAFDADKADFSGMASQEKLYIGAVIHKAFVAVDEDGTEAAAATAVVMRAGAMPRREEPKVVKADHPFVFLIRHNATGEILFMGRVANPKE